MYDALKNILAITVNPLLPKGGDYNNGKGLEKGGDYNGKGLEKGGDYNGKGDLGMPLSPFP